MFGELLLFPREESLLSKRLEETIAYDLTKAEVTQLFLVPVQKYVYMPFIKLVVHNKKDSWCQFKRK